MRRFVLVPLWACVLGLPLAAARDAAAQAGGSITGQALVRERANGEQSLLVTAQNKDAPLDGVTVALPANLRVNLGSAPPGWTFKQDGRELQASGPPYSRVNLRFDTARNSDMLKRLMRQGGETIQLEIRVPGVRGVQRVGFKVAQLPKVEVLTSLEGALTVPPQVTPGQPFIGTPAPNFTSGRWRMSDGRTALDVVIRNNLAVAMADYRAQAIESIINKVAHHLAPFEEYVPTELEIQKELQYMAAQVPEGPAIFTYVDQWNEQHVNAPAGWSTAPPSECPLAITGGTPQTFAGQDACVSGCFSELEKAAEFLMLDGERALEVRAASPTTMLLPIPADVMPGAHRIEWRMPFAPDTSRLQALTLGVLQLQGAIDQNQLWTGQSTTMRLLVVGTDKPTALNIVNRTPGVIAVEGGVRQQVTTPGSEANAVTRSVRGIMKGNFDIGYSLDQPVCGAGFK